MATTPRDRLLQFTRHYAAGEFDSALELIDALLAEHPEAGPMHWQRARTLEKLRRWDETRKAVDKVIELRHGFAPAWVLRAELSPVTEPTAETDLRKAISLDPTLGRPRYLLALLIHGRGGNMADARRLMDEAIVLDSTLHEALATRAGWNRIEAYTEPGMRTAHLEKALSDFERAISVEPLPDYRFARADILRQLGRDEEAIPVLENLLAEIPPGEDLHGLAEEAWREAMSKRSAATA